MIVMFYEVQISSARGIERANVDGSDRNIIVTGLTDPAGLDFNANGSRIYFLDASTDKLESVDLWGNNRTVHLEASGIHPYAIAVVDDSILFTDASRSAIGVGSLNSSTISFHYGSFFSSPRDIHVFIDTDECTAGTAVCDVNARCLNTIGSYTCQCNAGYVGNGTTCSDMDPPVFSVCPSEPLVLPTDSGGNTRTDTLHIFVDDSGAQPVNRNDTLLIFVEDSADGPVNVSCVDESGQNLPLALNPPILNISSTYNPFVLDFGLTNITCTAVDDAGNSAECDIQVQVVDNEPPVIECPDAIVQPVDTNMMTTSVALKVNSTDNVNLDYTMCTMHNATGTILDMTLQMFVYGSHSVFCQAVDTSGLSSTCTFPVNITDEEPPTIILCNPPVLTPTDLGRSTGIAAIVVLVADNTDRSPSVSCVDPNGRNIQVSTAPATPPRPVMFDFGSVNVTCTASDIDGNSAECIIQVTVFDIEAPVAQCPDVTLNTTRGLNSSTVHFPLTSTDNVDSMPTVNCTYQSGGTFFFGNTTVDCEISDTSGNTDTCQFNVMIIDNEDPVAQCPDVTLNTTRGLNSSTVNFPNTSTDNVDSMPTANCTYQSGGTFFFGNTTVDCVISDTSGNTDTCQFNVMIIDNEPPVIECPVAIVQPADTNMANTSVAHNVNSTDNVNLNYKVCTNATGMELNMTQQMFVYGSHSVSCEAVDTSGLSSTCTFLVNITDEDPPMITACSTPVVTRTDPGRSTGNASITAIVTDAIDHSPSVSCVDSNGRYLQDTIAPVVSSRPHVFDFGSTNVTCTASDMDGNSAECIIQVMVFDNEDPVAQCPDVTLNTTRGLNSATVHFPNTSTDNVDSIPIANCTYRSGSTFYFGNTTVDCVISDTSGNTDTCQFNVMIIDEEKPVPSCPEKSSTVSTSPGSNSASVSFPDVTDNVDANPTVNCNFSDKGLFQVGNHSVACTFQDSSGNVESCSYVIIVVDEEPPVPSCPAVLPTYQIPVAQSSVAVNFSVSATDNVDSSPNIACNHPSGSAFSAAQTIVECTFTDQSGNDATCAFAVNVEDVQAPSINCSGNMNLPTASGTNSATVTFSAAASDLVDASPSISCTPTSGSLFVLGDTTVSCIATDASGNDNDCSFNVRVEDQEEPTMQCAAPEVTANIGTTVARVYILDVTAEDNVDPSPTITCNPPSGELQEVGDPTNYNCTATDNAGNVASCNLLVTVQEPILTCFPPYESWYGECLLTSTFTTNLGILQINGVNVAALPDFNSILAMDGARYLAFRRNLFQTIIKIVGLPGNRIRLGISGMREGSILVDMNVAVAGRTEAEVNANTANVMDSSFTSQRNIDELPAGLDIYTMSFFQAQAATACNNYCQNGGTCRESQEGAEFCSCPDGFTGDRCENVVVEEGQEEEEGNQATNDTVIIGIIVGIFLAFLLFILLAISLMMLWRRNQLNNSRRLKWIQSEPRPPMEAYPNQQFLTPYIANGGPEIERNITSRSGPKLMFD